ncbi:hypothetical protein ACOMHN_004996 [Nucella lapillus]
MSDRFEERALRLMEGKSCQGAARHDHNPIRPFRSPCSGRWSDMTAPRQDCPNSSAGRDLWSASPVHIDDWHLGKKRFPCRSSHRPKSSPLSAL